MTCLLLASCGPSDPKKRIAGGADQPDAPTGEDETTFTLSGNLAASQFLSVDGDTNDTFSELRLNNDFISAQTISNPSIVKGFVTVIDPPGSGRFNFFSTDQFDVYSFTGFSGQQIFLEAADFDQATPALNDIDLILYDSLGIAQAVSMSIDGAYEALSVPSDGQYFIAVQARSGASNYTLSLSSIAGPISLGTDRIVQNLQPNAVILNGPPVTDAGIAFVDAFEHSNFSGSDASVLRSADVRIVDLQGARSLVEDDVDEFVADRSNVFAGIGLPSSYHSQSPEFLLLALLDRLNRLEGRDLFTAIEAGSTLQALNSDPVPLRSINWNLYDIGWEAAEAQLTGLTFAKTPVVAVIDSGYFTAHSDLRTQIIDQRDFVAAQFDGDGFDAEAEEIVRPGDNPACHGFHGTHVATTAAASSGDGGMIGVAPQSEIIALKIGFSSGPRCKQFFGDLAQAIRYAARLPNASNALPPKKADVINMSLGYRQPDPSVSAAIDAAVAEGVIVVAGVGNDSAAVINYPASFPNVIGVAATDFRRSRAHYSTFNSMVDIAAPGGDVRVDANGDGYGDGILGGIATLSGVAGFRQDYTLMNGTSMASPTVSGGIALMKAISPTLTQADVEGMLASGRLTEDIGAQGYDIETGYGLMSLPKMINAALEFSGGNPSELPDLILSSPSQVSFGILAQDVSISVERIRGLDNRIQGITLSPSLRTSSGGEWISLVNSETDADGFGTYTFRANRQILGLGTFQGTIGFEQSNGSTLNIPVSLTNASDEGTGTTGAIFFVVERLNEAGEFVTAVDDYRIEEGASGGSAIASISGLRAGSYRVIYGTDMDSDNLICDEGELCGALPFNSSRFDDTIEVDQNLSGLDFSLNDLSGVALSSEDDQAGERPLLRKINRD
nr:S8 family serine peptidase [Parvularcula mediterranea]